ncbi:MAG: hypothetical protein ACO1Q7_12535 [Gemmatimonas sp.]
MSTETAPAATHSESFHVLDELNRIVHSHARLGVRGKHLHSVVDEHVNRRGLKVPPVLLSFFVDFVDKKATPSMQRIRRG